MMSCQIMLANCAHADPPRPGFNIANGRKEDWMGAGKNATWRLIRSGSGWSGPRTRAGIVAGLQTLR